MDDLLPPPTLPVAGQPAPRLPKTGTNTWALTGIAAALILLGVLATRVGRRNRTTRPRR